jgi:glycerol-3-phosphate cytidylyltransferase-like family protein
LDVPLKITKEFVKKHKIDCIVHGFTDLNDLEKLKEFYADVDDTDYLIYTHISTSDRMNKIKSY